MVRLSGDLRCSDPLLWSGCWAVLRYSVGIFLYSQILIYLKIYISVFGDMQIVGRSVFLVLRGQAVGCYLIADCRRSGSLCANGGQAL